MGKGKSDLQLGKEMVKIYFPNVEFSEFELRKIGKLLRDIPEAGAEYATDYVIENRLKDLSFGWQMAVLQAREPYVVQQNNVVPMRKREE